MSRHWNLYCVTCALPYSRHATNAAGQFYLWWNHREDEARALAKSLPQVIALDDARDAFDKAAGARGPDLDLGFYLQSSGSGDLRHISDIAEWARGHVEHDVRAIDEYGRIDETCGETFTCGLCDAHHYCGLDRNHDGDHSRNRPSPENERHHYARRE